jgi:anthranilate phosphoribosyltransferase
MIIKEAINKLIVKKDLTAEEMQAVMFDILNGGTKTADIIEFLTFLSSKGETADELTAAVQMMLKYVDPIIVNKPNILDTCGTGGDKLGTFNISTITAIVASGAGVVVAKHGNRSFSGKCGSADILEALGVNINMDRAKIKKCLEEIGIAFLFAPNLHPAMKHVSLARKEIAGKTMFNILGPLINPVRATNQLIGVYGEQWPQTLSRVLYKLGTKHVMVVHGLDGLDEVTTADKTIIAEVKHGEFKDYQITPEQFGFKRSGIKDLLGGDVSNNAQIARDILGGKKGPKRDIVLLNAGCAIYAADRAKSIEEGIKLAIESIDTQAALKKLELLKVYSR